MAELNGTNTAENLQKYLMFLADNRKFAINFKDIKSITSKGALHPIPEFPSYFAGSCIHEGKAVPVIDSRRRFGFQPIEYGERSCIVICFANTGEKNDVVGIITDSVSSMAEIPDSAIQECTPVNREAYTRYLKGVFMDGGEPCYVVDVSLMINECDIDTVMG